MHVQNCSIWHAVFLQILKNPDRHGIYERNRWGFDDYEVADGRRHRERLCLQHCSAAYAAHE